MNICYGPNYDKKNHFLLEVNQQVLESLDILTEDSYDFVLKGDTASFLCTDNKTYELKLVESSNTFLLLEENKTENNYKILMSTDHTLDIHEVIPNKYNIINALRDDCALNYSLTTGESNINGMIYINLRVEEIFYD